MTPSPAIPRVTVVVVLYGLDAHASPALRSLTYAIEHLRDRFAVEVHDNSMRGTQPPVLAGLELARFVSRRDNPGLAVPYNDALRTASLRGSTWLMLLDEDTTVTREFIEDVTQLVDSSVGRNPAIGVAVPRLVQGGAVWSPHGPIRLRPRVLREPGHYPPTRRYTFMNSGSLIKVSAAQAIGGFPEEFPLDQLDHVVADRLRGAGFTLVVLNSRLEHRLSVLSMSALTPSRLRSYLSAEDRYYASFARPSDSAWLLVRRTARAALVVGRLRRSSDRALELSAVGAAVRILVRASMTSSGRRRKEGSRGHVES